MSSCCVHPIASVPKDMHSTLHPRVLMFRSFVHCIVDFPCTLLQVVIVLNFTQFSCDSWSHITLHVSIFDLLAVSGPMGLPPRLPACTTLRAAGGIL